MSRPDLDRLLHPAAVAIVGPLDRGRDPERTLRTLRERFGDRFHLVDPGGGTFGGLPVHASVADVPAAIDLAVLDVAPDAAVAAADECGRAGAAGLVVTASGFSAAHERELVATVRRHGMRMIGPNGNTNMFEPMPAPVSPRIGRIGLVTQSGHMGRVISQSSPHGVAFSRWVPTGDEADLEAADFIEYLAHDPGTAVIAGYFEGFRDGARLRRALAAANAMGKPVVMIKVGRNQAATRMAATHSAHLTGSDAAFDGLCRQYGVLRVDDVDELIETAALHAKLRPGPAGDGVGLYGYAGGAVALMADVAEASGVRVPVLSPDTLARLHRVLPEHLGVTNPVDCGNLYRTGTEADRREVFDAIGADPDVGVLVCASSGVITGITDDFASDILAFAAAGTRPVVVTWITWEMDTPAYDALVRSGVPLFRSFRSCFRALHGLFERRRRADVIGAARPEAPPVTPIGRTRTLGSVEAAALLARHGIPLAEAREVGSAQEARAAALALGLPAVVKVDLPGVPHRSDAGLVRTGLRTAAEVADAYGTLLARAADLAPAGQARVLVQRHVTGGVETIVGVTRDEALGPAVLVGMGGVLAELLRDVSVRPLPLVEADAEEMVWEPRGSEVLRGVRGAPAADVAALTRVVLAVAALAADPDARVTSLDLNPVIAGPDGAVAVDWLVEVADD